MKQGKLTGRFRFASGVARLTIVLLICSTPGLRAEPCLPIQLQGLSGPIDGGERVRVTAQLTNGCNRAIVDSATLVCLFAGGQEIRQALLLFPREGEGYTQAEAEIVVPRTSFGVSGECFVEFTQCNKSEQTCAVELSVDRVIDPGTSPSPVPVPRPSPKPQTPKKPPQPKLGSPSRGGGAGTFFRGLGWLGVAVGLAAYADAGSKEEEGLTAEADESEKLGNDILLASGALLLVGYSMNGSGFAPDGDPPPFRKFRPTLAVDPVHRAVYVQVSFSFD